MVLQLSQPLAEIVQLIVDNIYQLNQHTHQLLMEIQTMEGLEKKLYMPVIDIRVMELDMPVTVCTAPNCSIVYKVADKNKYHYKQRCHNPCSLKNVPREVVGDPSILKCTAMGGTETCKECNCRFNTHMHIYYETKTFENKIVDKNVLKNIATIIEDAAKEIQKVINKILDHKDQLEKEHKYIIKCVATFAHFLQQNAITPVNDALKEYVNYLIVREENLGPQSDRATLNYLKRLLSEYEQEKKILDEALKHSTTGIVDLTPIAIEDKIRDLFTLNHFGKKIKQLYDLHKTGGLREHKQSEFVVKEQYTLSIADRVKKFFGFGKSKQHQVELQHDRMLQRMCYIPNGQEQQLHPGMHGNLQFNGNYPDYFYFGHYNEWEPPHYGEPQYHDRGDPSTWRRPQRPPQELEWDEDKASYNRYSALTYNGSPKEDFNKKREFFGQRSEKKEKRLAERRRQAKNNSKVKTPPTLKHSKQPTNKKNETQKSASNNINKKLAITPPAPDANTDSVSSMEIVIPPASGGKKGKKKKNKKKNNKKKN